MKNKNNLDLEKHLIHVLEESKAEDITVLDVKHLTSVTDKMIICTATSQRHVKALTNHVVMEAKKVDHQPFGVEGEDSAEWVLIDLGEIIMHIMIPELREYYSLEKLWSMTESSRNTTTEG